MKRFLVPFILLGAAISLAQDRTITVREIDVQPSSGLVEILPDGGCLLTAYGRIVSPSVTPTYVQSRYPFNGARCTAATNAILQAFKNDLGVGNGAVP